MKYIKLYEKMAGLHDYVVCCDKNYLNQLNSELFSELNNFLTNNMGKVVEYLPNSIYQYKVQFNNVPENLKEYFTSSNCRGFKYDEIVDSDRNKKTLELRILANKYNL